MATSHRSVDLQTRTKLKDPRTCWCYTTTKEATPADCVQNSTQVAVTACEGVQIPSSSLPITFFKYSMF
ncbi:hypothetical protein DAI22_01g304050 [Oryza sativa Japonica Group]|nr:hypothetical protein DAI22_01g304050 [Oryza sativa Japonica Group]